MNYYLNIDLADNGSTANGYKNLFFAGVVNGMAFMVLVWILFFTLIHEGDEGVMSNALISGIVEGDDGNADGNGGVVGEDSVGSSSGMDDSEF